MANSSVLLDIWKISDVLSLNSQVIDRPTAIKMSSARFFLYCLILLSGDSVWSKMCRWTQFQLGSKNEECVSLLYQMVRIFLCPIFISFVFLYVYAQSGINLKCHFIKGGNFPLGCLNEKGARLFPAEAYRDSQVGFRTTLNIICGFLLQSMLRLKEGLKWPSASSSSWRNTKTRTIVVVFFLFFCNFLANRILKMFF